MKRSIVLILLLFTLHGIAQSKRPSHALLWKVSGRGLSMPSYLFGTIHMVCAKDFYISSSLKSAMEEVSRVVFELNLNDPELSAKVQQVMYSPISLDKRLSIRDYHRLDSLLQLKTSVPLRQFDHSSLMAVSSFLSSRLMLCGQPKSYEASLLAMAKAKQKTIAGLESPEQQMEFFNKAFSDSLLVSQMLDAKRSEILFEKMVRMYKEEDINGLYSIFDDEEAKTWILDIRNANWIKTIPGIMKKESTLFAVGAGHLGGNNGLIKNLRRLGYTVKPFNQH